MALSLKAMLMLVHGSFSNFNLPMVSNPALVSSVAVAISDNMCIPCAHIPRFSTSSQRSALGLLRRFNVAHMVWILSIHVEGSPLVPYVRTVPVVWTTSRS
jgi:hypothetical protein